VANGPFSRLADLVNEAGIRLRSPVEGSAEEEKKVADADTRPPHSGGDDLFLRAMEGVNRPPWQRELPPMPETSPVSLPDPNLQARRLMEAAVAGNPPLTVVDHPEYIEGWVGVAGKRFLPKLRNGLYSIQGQIDLHGLTRDEARATVEEYVFRMARFRSCCIKIVHGRGINSPNDRAILKEGLQRWLSTRKMSHCVVAYASAPFSDGGLGAVYVLLRRQ